jgi:hypothetical protein
MGDSLSRRPSGVSDETVEAVGKLSEALETIERARGHLYSVHQLVGHADLLLDDAATLLEKAGKSEWAEQLRTRLIGLNVVEGRWTFQVVEEFDDGYWTTMRDFEREARDKLVNGVRHIYEAEMKRRRITPGRTGHEPVPQE